MDRRNSARNWRNRNYVFDHARNEFVLKKYLRPARRSEDVSVDCLSEIYGVSGTPVARIEPSKRSKPARRKTFSRSTRITIDCYPEESECSDSNVAAHASPVSLSGIPNHNNDVLLTQHNIMRIVHFWHRTLCPKSTNARDNHLILSSLTSFSVHRFEFDDQHHSITACVQYEQSTDDELSATEMQASKPNMFKSKSSPAKLRKLHKCKLPMMPFIDSESETSDASSQSSSAHTNNPRLCKLSPSVSFSPPTGAPAQDNLYLTSTTSNDSNQGNQGKPSKPSKLDHHFECSASLAHVRWGTILFGAILDAPSLGKSVYVCNVKIDKLGYGVGCAFFGAHSNKNHERDLFCDANALNQRVQERYNGYPDAMNDCCVLYDDGECCDWNLRHDSDKLNVNELPKSSNKHERRNESNTIRVVSKLSKLTLRANKKTDTVASLPRAQKPVMRKMAKSASGKESYVSERKLKRKSFYGGGRRKAKKVSDKFAFDEKSDVIQISVDLARKRISVHNLNNHRCVVVKDFEYDMIRIGFVLRYSSITIIDQKWV